MENLYRASSLPPPLPQKKFLVRRVTCKVFFGDFCLYLELFSIPDSWVKEIELDSHEQQAVPLGSLPTERLRTLGVGLVGPRRRRKQRRK